MTTIEIKDASGKKAGDAELSASVFGIEPNVPVMHQVVRAQRASWRAGTSNTLTRGQVRGGGRKIYRQKGTGNARHHGNRAPQIRHGGVVFAPKPRDYVINVPRKVRRLAFKSALTSKLMGGDIIVVDAINLPEAKTKLMAKVLGNFDLKGWTMLVLPGRDETLVRASGNIEKLQTSYVNTLNVYDILKAGKIILTKDALKGVEEVYA